MTRDYLIAVLVDALHNPERKDDALVAVGQWQALRRDQKRERKRATLCVAYCKGLSNAALERGRA